MLLPEELVIGDTWTWQVTELADRYPSPQWSLRYYLINQDNNIVIDATADPPNFLVFVSNSSFYTPGEYRAYIRVSNGSTILTIEQRRIKLLPNPAVGTIDTRSHVKKVLDALEAAIEGRASRVDMSISIAGKSIQFMTPSELIRWHSHYKQLYEQELIAEALKKGINQKNIYVRFK